MQNKNEYQGWANAQTWSLALTMDNTKQLQDKMIGLCSSEAPIQEILKFCASQKKEIENMAPWAWPFGYDSLKVNWTEIRKHYQESEQ